MNSHWCATCSSATPAMTCKWFSGEQSEHGWFTPVYRGRIAQGAAGGRAPRIRNDASLHEDLFIKQWKPVVSEQARVPESRQVTFAELGLEYVVGGCCPVQANGTIRGRQFYFHARHSNWTFEVANDLGELPSDVGGNAVFFLESRHNDAGYMSSAEASRIVEACSRLFLEVTAGRLKILGT